MRGHEIRDYIDAITQDSGAMVQLMPEAMDLFIAGVEDRSGVLYQSTASMAPPPSPRTFLQSLGGRWSAVSGVLFDLLYEITSLYNRQYPCAASERDEANERTLVAAFGRLPDFRANDGVVPIRSQVWGTLAWAGYGDHLDVLGHFRGGTPPVTHEAGARPPSHVDWLCSGSKFDAERFEAMVDAIVTGMLDAATRRPRRVPVS